MVNLIDRAHDYATRCHRETNHRYDGRPYEFHLEMVVREAYRFLHLVPEADRPTVVAAAWCHDVIEDCRQTYNDVVAATSVAVADIVYAVTNEKGKTRADRASGHYYEGIRKDPLAVFVKLCDRLANAGYSQVQGTRMFDRYREEHSDFVWEMSGGMSHAFGGDETPYPDMVKRLDRIFLREEWFEVPDVEYIEPSLSDVVMRLRETIAWARKRSDDDLLEYRDSRPSGDPKRGEFERAAHELHMLTDKIVAIVAIAEGKKVP